MSAGALLAAAAVKPNTLPPRPAKKRYAVVGVGSRAYMYLDAIQTNYAGQRRAGRR